MSLFLAQRGTRVLEAEVIAVPEPPFTQTWHPVSHAELIRTLYWTVLDADMIIWNREYSMNQSGTKMFGVWELSGARNTANQAWNLGIRNSIDKSMTVGLVAGLRVLVCDNLVFSGDIVLLRRHTRGLNDETLKQLCQQAMGQTSRHLAGFENWFEALNDIILPNPSVSKLLTFEAVKAGILPGGAIMQIYRSFFEPEGRYYASPQTLGNWHNAVTHTMHGDSLFNVQRKNQRLSKLIDHWYGNRLPNMN
jgi:hypothetical protein